MKKNGVLYSFFSILLILSVSFSVISCNDRDEEVAGNSDFSTYKVEIKYSGDIQNWEERLSISTTVKSPVEPSLKGVVVSNSEKISDAEYRFLLPQNSPFDKNFETSPNIKSIAINGNITMKNSNAQQVTAVVKVYKNNELKFESPFVFNSSNTYPYYNINVN
ncbi:hypothetical protein MKJ01_15115 [Chryseobacterium sp. SSA4.19]|uniref:beta-barrel fold lipoprotein n=1 Tax=Chryseobacterium sp. SSA4.19 TaxID=2919915 RepID=UPI001F4DC9E5|nr:hypothetical protein [Chryseobacterium sp. SSA4.19]MCJ8155097.1 hypothetical protein [Chryseobacterium sp. SSA4.19]